MTIDNLEELFPLYVLDGLSSEDRAAVEKYVAQNPAAEARLLDLLETTMILPPDVEPIEPTPQAKRHLMARVRADAHRRAAQLNDDHASRSIWGRLGSFFQNNRLGWALAMPAFLGLIGLGLYTFSLNSQFNSLLAQNQLLQSATEQIQSDQSNLVSQNGELVAQITQLTKEKEQLLADAATDRLANEELASELASLEGENEALAAQILQISQQNQELTNNNELLLASNNAEQSVLQLISSPDVQAASLPGTEAQPGAEAQFLMAPGIQLGLLVASDLAPLEAGQAYQVLLIYETGHDTAETFAVDSDGETVLLVHMERAPETFTAIGVSIEPVGGSEQRTGEIVLLGDV